MRAMGLPARVVTGYQGATLNEIDGYYVVRQSDAHAWAEVWIDQRGWIRVDPTAAVAPERVIQNLSSAQAGVSGLMRRTLSTTSWLRQLYMQWDAINNSWNIWVLSYNETKQIDLMALLGISGVNYLNLILIFVTTGGITIAAMFFSYMRKTIPTPPVERLYQTLCRGLEKRGITKAKHEAPLGFSLRIEQQLNHPVTPAPALQNRIDYPSVQEFLCLYSRYKYASDTPFDHILLARLKFLLKHSFKPER